VQQKKLVFFVYCEKIKFRHFVDKDVWKWNRRKRLIDQNRITKEFSENILHRKKPPTKQLFFFGFRS